MPKGLFGNKSPPKVTILSTEVMAVVVSEHKLNTRKTNTHIHTRARVDFGAKIKEIDGKHF